MRRILQDFFPGPGAWMAALAAAALDAAWLGLSPRLSLDLSSLEASVIQLAAALVASLGLRHLGSLPRYASMTVLVTRSRAFVEGLVFIEFSKMALRIL